MTRHRDTYFGHRTLRLALKAQRKRMQKPWHHKAIQRALWANALDAMHNTIGFEAKRWLEYARYHRANAERFVP